MINPSRARILLSCLALLLLPGCVIPPLPDRVNHVHSDANQQIAQSAFTNFQQFASQTGGNIPLRLTNLNAELTLAQTVDETKASLFNSQFATSLTQKSWNDLRWAIAEQWGLNKTDFMDNSAKKPDPVQMQTYLSNALTNRLWKVRAVGSVLSALVAGQKAVLSEAAQAALNASNNLNTAVSAASIKAPPITNYLELLQSFNQAVITSGQQYAADSITRGEADVFEAQLLSAAKSSVDPASAYSLAAVVGTGLDHTSFTNLDNYLESLQENLLILDSRLLESDVTNLANLATALRAPESSHLPYKQIYDKLSTNTQAQLNQNSTNTTLLKRLLTQDLNQIIVGKSSLYDAHFLQFTNGIKRELLDPAITNPALIAQVNRLLLDNAFTNALAPPEVKWKANSSSSVPANVAWQKFKQALDNARTAVSCAALSDGIIALPTDPKVGGPRVGGQVVSEAAVAEPGATVLGTPKYMIALHTLSAEISPVTSADRISPFTVEGSAAPRQLHLHSNTQLANLNSTNIRVLLQTTLSKLNQSAPFTTAYLATNLPSIVQDISTSLADFNSLAQSVQSSAESTNLVRAVTLLNGLTNLSQTEVATYWLTNLVPGFTSKYLQGVTSPLTAAQLQQIGTIFSDITAQGLARSQRLLSFFADLRNIQVNLFQENLRHYEAMGLITSQELHRWHKLSRLNTDYSEAFAKPDHNQAEQRINSLFYFSQESIANYSNGTNDQYAAALKATGIKAYASTSNAFTLKLKDAYYPPVLNEDAPIWASIRLLAENAAAWQKAPPGGTDPLGFYAQLSNRRCWQAVRLAQGYYLMLALNQKYASANSRSLAREIQEHAVLLDGIASRVDEADIRLRLGDSLAFHSSGINQADMQAFIGLAQQISLGFIATH